MHHHSSKTATMIAAILGLLAGSVGCVAEDVEIADGLEDEGDTEIGDSVDEDVAMASQELTSLSYSTFLGGAGDEYAVRPGLDSAGNLYVARSYPTSNNGQDILVTKYSPTGAVLYSVSFGETANEWPRGLAVDGVGNAYVLADTSSDGTTPQVLVAKLNPSGTALLYYSRFGGSGSDSPTGIAVDGAGNAYVTGDTDSTDFPTTPGAVQPTLAGSTDAFVAKLNASGTALLYSTYLGGAGTDNVKAIAVDAYGYAYVTGRTLSLSAPGRFPTTPGAFMATPGGGLGDIFVTQLVPSGTSLYYSTFLGGSGNYEEGAGIAVDASFNAYVTGRTDSANFATTWGAYRTSLGSTLGDGFVTKLNASGNGLLYSTYLWHGSPSDIAVTSAGKAYITGDTNSTTFPTTPTAFRKYFSGWSDGFVMELNASGSALNYSTYVGGSDLDAPVGIKVDNKGNAYVAGWTYSKDFPIFAAMQPTWGGGNWDAFLLKISGP